MRTVAMLTLSVERVVTRMIPDLGRERERTWLAGVIRRSLVTGDEFACMTSRAPRPLVRVRMSLESNAFRRAVREGGAVFVVDTDVPASRLREIVAHDWPDGEQTCLGEVVDWLLSLEETEPHMLGKLSRMTLPQAAARARAWHTSIAVPRVAPPRQSLHRQEQELFALLRSNTNNFGHTIPARADRNHVEPPLSDIFMAAGDGRRWERLLNAAALDEESTRMGHCVGRGSYDSGVAAGTTWILSLRGDGEKSFCTVEWIPAVHDLAQVKGPGNRPVAEECLEDVIALARRLQPLSASVRDLTASRLQANFSECHDNGLDIRLLPPGTPRQLEYVTVHEGTWSQLVMDRDVSGLYLMPPLPPLHALFMPNEQLHMQHYLAMGRWPFDQGPVVRKRGRTRATTTGGGRIPRRKTARSLAWETMPGRYSVDILRGIAANPAASDGDRTKARNRLRELLAPARPAHWTATPQTVGDTP